MQSNRMSKRFWIFGLLAATAALPALAQPVFSGNELRLSGPEHERLQDPAVGFFEDEGFVAVWEDRREGLTVRTFAAAGEASGTERVLVANDAIGALPFRGLLTSGHQPELVPAGGESFLLFWTEEREEASIDIFFESRQLVAREVMGQLFELGGTPVGEPFQVSADAGFDGGVAAARSAGGGTVVVWESRDGDSRQIFGRLLDADGELAGEPFLVGNGELADVAALPGGQFLVVWGSCCDEPGGATVLARRFDSQGGALGEPFAVAAEIGARRAAPRVAAGPGGFLVVWQTKAEDGDAVGFRVFGRQLRPNGEPAGAAVMLSAGAFGDDHSAPVAAPAGEGRFLVSWVTWKDDFRVGVYGAEIGAGGRLGSPFRINQQRVGALRWPAVAVTADHGRHLVAWVGFDDAGQLGIEGRLLGTAASPPARSLCAGLGGSLPFDLLRQRVVCR